MSAEAETVVVGPLSQTKPTSMDRRAQPIHNVQDDDSNQGGRKRNSERTFTYHSTSSTNPRKLHKNETLRYR